MYRRRLLGALGAGTLLAGCIGRGGDPPSDASGTTTDGTTADGTTTNGPATTDAGDGSDDGRTLAVERVETFSHAIRINDLGEAPYGRVPSPADLDEREREVVEAALDGGYETDDPPDWLVAFLTGTPHVVRDGQYYRLEHTLPTYTVTGERVSEDEVDGEIASREVYQEAVTHDGRVMSGLARIALREGAAFTDPWPGLRTLTEEYGAVRYQGDLVALSMTVDDPGPPYAVTAEPVSLEDVAGRSVWNVAEASADLREVLRAAGEAEGLYPLDDPPDGLLEGLDDHERLFLDGRFYTTYVEKRRELPVSLDATVPEPSLSGEGARLRLALTNESDGVVTVTHGAPPPFGVLSYHPAGEPGDRRTLWTDAYEASQHVHVEDGTVKAVNAIGLATELEAGGEAARTFTVRETDLPAGEYVVEDDVGIELPDAEGGSFPFRVHLRVE